MRPAGAEVDVWAISGIKQLGQDWSRAVWIAEAGADRRGERRISNEVPNERVEPDPELFGKLPSLVIGRREQSVHALGCKVAFKAVPTASARNWMQASVPSVGQDVTAVRLFDWLAVLPVTSAFGVPVSDEVTPAASIAGGNIWPVFMGYWVFVVFVTAELRRALVPGLTDARDQIAQTIARLASASIARWIG